MSLPLHPSVVHHAQPGLVDVEEDVAILPELEKPYCPLLTKHAVFIRVSVERALLDPSVPHAKLVDHSPAYHGCFDNYLLRSLQIASDHIDGANDYASLIQIGDKALDLPLQLFFRRILLQEF